MQFACSLFMYEPGTRPLNCMKTTGVFFCLQSYINIHSSFGTNFMAGQVRELHFSEH